ncbi:antitoxin VapB [Kribbella sp. VKM Ac-2527]|uniref:Antitoxin VapB n=1 Tax=Kribbella caucasensis TaxID=2512215 RepID=A0A4R6JH15_9ACTN|nr:M24 family metallopeptidase [Kribbella sp. VKM Ac-2527]TDO34817.1 antitoxin VapB [Kribbella sp. VKM Ac-2527]
MGDRRIDFTDKLGRLAALGTEQGLESLVLRTPASLTWLLGARVHVPQTLDSACLDVVVDLSGQTPTATVVTNTIEAPRLRDTELSGLDVDWRIVPWWQPRDSVLPTGPTVGSDGSVARTIDVAVQVATLRRVLTMHQQALLAHLCSDAASAATEAAYTISPDMTEYAAAAVLAAALLGRGLDPIVLMVAGDDRRREHRHPLPTDAPIGHRAMLVCCARRHGLVASVTRLVAFGDLRAEEKAHYRALLEVERAFLDASMPGVRLGDAFASGTAAYGANGFEPGEWHRHHQGGFSGLQPREFPAHHGSDAVVPAGSVLAWNPSAAGWKVEDTAVIRPHGAQVLVHDPSWPVVNVGGRHRPGVLVR